MIKHITLLIVFVITGCATQPMKYTVLATKPITDRTYIQVKSISGLITKVGTYDVTDVDEILELNAGDYEISMTCLSKYLSKQKVVIKPIPKTAKFNLKKQFLNVPFGENGRAMIGFVCHPVLKEFQCSTMENQCNEGS